MRRKAEGLHWMVPAPSSSMRTVGQVAGVAEPIEIRAHGLTKEALMGKAGTIAALPVYQLALPCTHEAQRVIDDIPLMQRIPL